MLPEERRKKIIEILAQKGAATVNELSERLQVVPITIRRDLDCLEKQQGGLLIRTHGGAILSGEPFLHKSLSSKESINHEAKQKIGHKAAELVNDGETLILDEGSTCIEVAKALISGGKVVTVVTNGIKVAMELAPCSNITTVLMGGLCGHQNYAAYGHDTVESFRKIRVHKYFMGIDALIAGYGISDGDPHQVQLKLAKAASSREVIGVADASKVGKVAVFRVGPLSLISCLIMDHPAPESIRRALEEEKIKLLEA
ncbi:MAG: DeoR/GlpR family DNA-binding transcription regulator [Bacillota bacterium]